MFSILQRAMCLPIVISMYIAATHLYYSHLQNKIDVWQSPHQKMKRKKKLIAFTICATIRNIEGESSASDCRPPTIPDGCFFLLALGLFLSINWQINWRFVMLLMMENKHIYRNCINKSQTQIAYDLEYTIIIKLYFVLLNAFVDRCGVNRACLPFGPQKFGEQRQRRIEAWRFVSRLLAARRGWHIGALGGCKMP